jgi:hypothetical protein
MGIIQGFFLAGACTMGVDDCEIKNGAVKPHRVAPDYEIRGNRKIL